MFLDTVRATIASHRMLRKGDRVLIGVSGGPDSMALWSALVALRKELSLDLRAAYLDHGLRPAAARREAAFVRRWGRLWGVPVDILRRSVRRSGGESWEEKARQVRYEALGGLARRLRCQAIALGHTQDDQAETVLIWILRGTGMSGLAGIPPVRKVKNGVRHPSGVRHLRVIRPLIDCSRRDLEAALESHRIRPMIDSTNDSPRFLRNRIRRQLIPLLESRYNPQVRRHLAQLAQTVREEIEGWAPQLRREFQRVARVKGPKARMNRRRLRALPTALRRGILRLAVERMQGDGRGFRRSHWVGIDGLLFNGVGKGLDLPHGFRAESDSASLWLIAKSGTLKRGV